MDGVMFCFLSNYLTKREFGYENRKKHIHRFCSKLILFGI